MLYYDHICSSRFHMWLHMESRGFFLTGCRTATGPVSGSAVFTPATTDGSCWFSLMDPSAAGSASSVVLTFTASISLHVRVMACCTSRQTNRDLYPRNNGRNICLIISIISVRARRVTATLHFCLGFEPHFHHDISFPQPRSNTNFWTDLLRFLTRFNFRRALNKRVHLGI